MTIGACRNSNGSHSPTSWHFIAACPSTAISSATASIQSPFLANNTVATLPDVQERKSFASKMLGLLFPQKTCKILCQGRQFSSPPPASMILLPPTASPTTATSKQKGLEDLSHRHRQHQQRQELKPQPAYGDGSNTYYVINLDRQGTTATPAALPSKGDLLHPHPQQSCLTSLAPGLDTSYV
ncbi:hypothetical protein ECG_08500 [Echinococcus granulosus]|uniref:Expressed conserved protein n=1 Tax=Echinococcus granulosus TaxID=6210 RepID=A0A068WLE7_ECHGR|nr:hypothetical protein ECG_08500 [Echinococcus granulosus]CDS20938.1 hypothetical protein EgrG_000529800 [Echinococcus granulosus]